MRERMHATLQVLIGLFIADLIVSLVHWYEDNYIPISTTNPLLKHIAISNEIHHIVPYAITTYSLWENFLVTFLLMGISLLLLFFTWPNAFKKYMPLIATMVLIIAPSNIVHRWIHERPCRRPQCIQYLQQMGILVSSEEHSKHHRLGSESYGVILAPTNVLYDAIGLFPTLEATLKHVFGKEVVRKKTIEEYTKTYIGLNPQEGVVCPDAPALKDVQRLEQTLRSS